MHKIFSMIFIVIFFITFSFFEGEEYYDFHKDKKETLGFEENNNKLQSDFQLDDIQDISDISFYKTPDTSLLTQIINEIHAAQSRIYLETYILTEKKIQNALIQAQNRGIDIQILLEKNPYKAYNINNKAFKKLVEAGIQVHWSDTEDYSLNHSKFLIIDDIFYISTGNYSYSTFKYNRDFFIRSENSKLLDIILQIFSHDYNGDKKQFYHPNIVLSPFNSRDHFENLFHTAEHEILLYFQYFKDDLLVEQLIQKQKEGVKVKAIIPESALKNNIKTLKKLDTAGVSLHIMKKHKMHAKAILIDKKYLFIGSINFSTYSLDQNRELGILIKNKKIIDFFIQSFQDDKAKNTVKNIF
ncbi:MAG: hypothetical protein GY828_05945 [Candidatus Gracilibacteria bacterium]|nr:hypothetical protein [Candidatus Gracilibacteria bacterium]